MTFTYILHGNSISEVIKKEQGKKTSFLMSFTQFNGLIESFLYHIHLMKSSVVP